MNKCCEKVQLSGIKGHEIVGGPEVGKNLVIDQMNAIYDLLQIFCRLMLES